MGTLRKLLIATVIVGSLAGIAGSGTFASFNATTTNAASAFDTGFIALSNKVASGTTCWSTGATGAVADATFSNSNLNACDALFTAKTDVKPGMTDIVSDITVSAQGPLTPSSLKVYMATTCTTANDTGTVHGPPTTVAGDTGDVCGWLRMTIQEFNAGFTVAGTCYYGNNSCVTANNTLTVYSFQNTPYTTPANGLSLGTLAAGTATTAGTSSYFRVTFSFPSSATPGFENNVMGKKLNSLFALGWTIDS